MENATIHRLLPLFLAARPLPAFLLLLAIRSPTLADPAEEARLREAARLRSVALARMEDGEYERAADHLEELARALPDNILPPVNLAICYYRLNRAEEALRQVERARQLDPDNARMLYTLARILGEDPGRARVWREVIDHFAATHPRDPRPYYLEARHLALGGQFAAAVPLFQQALASAPENLVLLADLLVAAAEAADAETTAGALYGIEDRRNGFEGSMADYARRIHHLVEAGKTQGLRPAARVMRNLLRPTELYRLHLVPLTGVRQAGGAGLFPQHDFDPPLPGSIQGGQDIDIAFAQSGDFARLDLPQAATWRVGRQPGRELMLGAGDHGLVEVAFSAGGFQARSIELQPAARGPVVSCDIDQDEIADLVIADPARGVLVYHGEADGSFAPARTVSAARDGDRYAGLFPLDIDHEGDLDLFVAVAREAAADLYLQNNGDGTWTERAAELGLAGAAVATTDIAVADFDDDGDLDLLTVHPTGHPRLYLNHRTGAFDDGSAACGLDQLPAEYRAVHTADFDNDGRFDLLLWGEDAAQAVFANRGAAFEPVALPGSADGGWSSAEVGDYDNDGDQDVAAIAAGTGELLLLRNRRLSFHLTPAGGSAAGTASLIDGDFDGDGDLDLLASGPGAKPRLFSNQGGNRNNWVRISLKGLNDNNAKNNIQGMFSRVEARAGDSFQVLLGNGGVNHLGLGARRVADVIRVVWTNGLAQNWQLVSANQTLVEEQVLKGSCPFLYTWDGDGFEFVTDLMWRSPLGMILADGSPAPHQSARDFVLIPGERLQPADGELWLQITEELWETAYVDRCYLLAVDHPAAVELVVDEKFTPPPYAAEAPIHWLADRLLPVAARDHQGRNVLAQLEHRDGDYVDGLPLSRYQGLTEGHFVEMTFPQVPAGERLRLVLWGWIFPTDTSINFALAQDGSRDLKGPSLEVRGADGGFRVLSPFIGFPNGKRKAMVVELTDLVPSGDLTLRIATSMQIYWDAAALAVGEPEALAVSTRLEPRSAELHYRGYSRLYREAASGPHLFDYAEVHSGPRFRDMRGTFTRYGPVAELLADEDDRYVVMNAGDEMTILFDSPPLPDPPRGWRRDYVLYTDGWVKDADLHTAFSQTVEPWPFHGMTAYPPESEYRPDGSEYLTRVLSDGPFRDALKVQVESAD